MKSRMPPQAYIDQAWFEREQMLFFKPLWQFIGLKMMLSHPNAFITRTLCNIPIVVQNFNGELRAFENLCPHRQNPLQQAPHGIRALTCNYHGWSHDSDGKVRRIPFEDQVFRYGEQERKCLGLRRFALSIVGNLVFVNLADDPKPIERQFNPDLLESLRECSEAFDNEVIMTTFKGRFNWKLAYENLRDSHHPRYLHAKTLYQQAKFEVSIDEENVRQARRLMDERVQGEEQAMSLLRDFSSGGLDVPMEQMPHYPWHDYVERFGDKDWYYNWLIFPNLHIASGSGGYSFIIEHHIPVAAGRTDFMVHYVTARKKRRYAASAAVLHAHMMGAEKVLREDINVLEKIQSGLHLGAPSAVLGDYESLNSIIETWYLDVMEKRIVL